MPCDGAQADDHRRRLRTGAALMVVAMTALGLFPTGARFAYEGGSTPETVAVARHLFTLVFVIGLLPAEGGGRLRTLALPRRLLPATVGLGALLAVYSWAYIAAIAYIPVSLAVLLLYTFPAQVVLMTTLLGMERASPLRLLAFAVAFAGVALAVGVNGAAPDPRGVALGLLAAFGLALITVLVARLSGMPDRRAATAGFALVAAALTAAVVLAGPGFALPATALAWSGLVFAGAAAGLGVTLFFVALPLLGPVRTALLSNLEPVVATLGAIAILGERPGAMRFAGIALVLGAIFLIQRSDRRG
ncbi:MAG: DMT family transporter [Alphaproteobacteria bacterium]|nr:DMT family transporter [Alphaproteobacteria bacterium]